MIAYQRDRQRPLLLFMYIISYIMSSRQDRQPGETQRVKCEGKDLILIKVIVFYTTGIKLT